MNNLLALYGYDYKRVEKIPTTTSNPSKRGKLPFAIHIAESKAESKTATKNATEEVQVYMDGSAINGKVGAATILTKIGQPPHILHMHLGPKDEHTIHEAELVGMLLGMQLIKTERHGSMSFMLGVNNQAAIKAFQMDLRSPGHHLAREFLQVANQVKRKRKRARYTLTIRQDTRE